MNFLSSSWKLFSCTLLFGFDIYWGRIARINLSQRHSIVHITTTFFVNKCLLLVVHWRECLVLICIWYQFRQLGDFVGHTSLRSCWLKRELSLLDKLHLDIVARLKRVNIGHLANSTLGVAPSHGTCASISHLLVIFRVLVNISGYG